MSTSEVRPKKKIGQGWLLGKMVAFLLGALVSASVLAVEIGETAPSFTIESLNSDETVSLGCLLYTSPSPRDRTRSRMPSSA